MVNDLNKPLTFHIYRLIGKWFNDSILPQEYAAIVAGGAVVTAPSEAFVVYGEVFCHRQDGVGEALDQRLTVPVAHVGWLHPGESLIEVDVEASVVLGDNTHGDIGVVKANGYPQSGIDFMRREGSVGRPDDTIRHVP